MTVRQDAGSIVVTRTTAEDAADFAAPEELHFDLSNPRFAGEERFATEEDIVRYLTQHVDVDELLQSIRSAGYVDFEPLIVQREGRIVLRTSQTQVWSRGAANRLAWTAGIGSATSRPG